MESNHQECLDVGVTEVAALAAALYALVDELDAHCRTESPVSPDFADEVHRLRLGAQRLFEPSA